jgi:hypothetical protein
LNRSFESQQGIRERTTDDDHEAYTGQRVFQSYMISTTSAASTIRRTDGADAMSLLKKEKDATHIERGKRQFYT